MSSRGRFAELAVALAAVTLAALPAAAQDALPSEAELVRSLEELAPAWQAARAEAARVVARREAAARARRVPLDTVRVGGVTVVAHAGHGAEARSVVAPVWEEHYAPWAEGAPPTPSWLTFAWSSDPASVRVPSRKTHGVRGHRPWDSRATLERRSRDRVGTLLTDQLAGTRMGLWLSRHPLRPNENGDRVYRRVATAPSTPARACLDGAPARCAAALALGTDDFPFDDWYTPEERRLLVQRYRELWTPYPAQHADRARCLDGEVGGCDRVLAFYRERRLGDGQATGSPYWGAPLTGEIRGTLLRQALERGGAGAWARLLEAADMEPARALEHASGVDVETLVAGWQRWLEEERPRRESALTPETLPALLWALFILPFALRSTRWRLG